MIEFRIRLQIFLKLWFTSVYTMIVMLLIPIVTYMLYTTQSYTINSLASMVYEKAAVILFIFILQWCFSVDVDSQFYKQIMTYPIARNKFLIERVLFSAIFFSGGLLSISIILTPFLGSFIWKALLFGIPYYIGIGGLVVFATIIGSHSIGGLFIGLVFWMISLSNGEILLYLNPVLLDSPNVYQFANGDSGFFLKENLWILYNRLFYAISGLLLIGLAIWRFNRKVE